MQLEDDILGSGGQDQDLDNFVQFLDGPVIAGALIICGGVVAFAIGVVVWALSQL